MHTRPDHPPVAPPGPAKLAIRQATPADASAIASIRIRGWQWAYRDLLPASYLDGLPATQEPRAAWWREVLSRPPSEERVWLAELAGRVVGYIGTGPSRDEDLGPTPEVYAVYLDPDAIGMGVGRTLFGHALDDLRRRGHRVAYLWVLAGNARARRFYEAAGGRPDGAQKTTCWPEVTFDEVRYGIDLG